MTEDRSTRGNDGRFTGSRGSGANPPRASPVPSGPSVPPRATDAGDAYRRFLQAKGGPALRGTLDRFVWRPETDEVAGMSRRRRRRLAGPYEAFTPHPITPWDIPVSADVSGEVSDAEAAIQALNARAHPALQPLARLLLRTESIASSKAEGLQVDAGHLARAEVVLDEGGRPRSETSIEIVNNIRAMETAIEQASHDNDFTVADVLAIHARLMTGHDHSGMVRTEQNWIGRADSPVAADFVPPPPNRVPALLDDVVAFVNDDTLPPVQQSAIVHAQFETIHPFLDGNGRTGRALIHVVWRRRGLAPAYVPPISLVFSRDRDRYIQGLTDFREGRVDGWIRYFAAAASSSADRAQAYITRASTLQAEWRQRVKRALPREPRRDAAVWALIDELPAHPAVTANRAIAALDRTKPAVNQALAQLEEASVIKRVNRGARNRVWEVPDLIQLIRETEE